jgi:predicted phage tail component-like protein
VSDLPRGCTFNNKHSDDLGLIMLSVNRQLLPANRDEYVYITQRDGAYLFPEGLEDRFIEIEFNYLVGSHQQIRSKAREIANWLYTTSRSELTFDDEPDKYYMAKLANQVDLENLVRAGRFTLTFRCLPYAYADIETLNGNYLYDNGHQYDTGLIYDNPTSFDWIYTKHRSGVFNHSTHKTPLIIKIEGTVTNPKITNETTGEQITLPSISSQTLIVDSEKLIITKAGSNALKNHGGVFPFILASGDNALLFQGLSPNATVTYQWKHKFL